MGIKLCIKLNDSGLLTSSIFAFVLLALGMMYLRNRMQNAKTGQGSPAAVTTIINIAAIREVFAKYSFLIYVGDL